MVLGVWSAAPAFSPSASESVPPHPPPLRLPELQSGWVWCAQLQREGLPGPGVRGTYGTPCEAGLRGCWLIIRGPASIRKRPPPSLAAECLAALCIWTGNSYPHPWRWVFQVQMKTKAQKMEEFA